MDNPPNSSKLSVQDEKNEGRSWSNAVRLQHKVKWKKRKGIKGNNKLKVKSWYALLMGNASPACCTPAGLEQQADWAAVPACFGNCSNTRTGDSSIILNHPQLFISAQILLWWFSPPILHTADALPFSPIECALFYRDVLFPATWLTKPTEKPAGI